MKNARRWATQVAILGAMAVGIGVLASPALAAGPSQADIFSSANPSSAGQDVTLTVVVHGTFQSPLGLVQLIDGAGLLGPPLVLSPDFDHALICKCVPTDHSSASLTRSFTAGTHVITVGYTGDGPLGNFPILPGVSVIFQVVTAAQSTTTVSSSADPAVYGQNVTFTASATSSGSPAAGTIQFKADGADLGAPQTVDAGSASVSASTLALGTHAITADFSSSDPNVLDSSGSLAGGEVVNPAETTTSVSSSANPSEFGGAVTFVATTTVDSPGSGAVSGTEQFEDNGTALGSPQSLGAGGHAMFTTADLSVGSHAITASFTSDTANFHDSAGAMTQIVNKARTTLSYDGPASGDFNDPAALSARLTRTGNASPIGGQTVTLAMGSESCSNVTDANGEAACTITPSEAAGPFTVAAAFAGDGNYLSSTGSTAFTVTREETTTTYTGPTVIAQGNPVTLSGQLLEDGTTPIAGRTLILTIGSGAQSQNCSTVPTNASGNAACTVPSVTVAQGPQPVKANFAGDGYYLPSADATKNVIVFAFPSRGIFVVGDRPVTVAPAPVTFWAARWSTLNVLSGGSPSAFKGFADTPSSKPPVCGGTWTSSPGNSSSPVESLPAYMGTAVAGSITKNGDTISGNITKIVVVVTAPGYAPDPGHAGTGTIIATYC